MERFRIVGLLIVLLFFAMEIHAGSGDDLRALRREAAARKDFDSYSAVCRYLYQTGEDAALLQVYADSIRQQARLTNKLEAWVEYYAWSSEAYFCQGNYTEGYKLKRKAIAYAEAAGKTEYLVDCASDMGYYFNVDAKYDSARYYFNKGMKAAEGHPELAAGYRVMLTNYASSYLYEGQTDSALLYTQRARLRSFTDRDTAMLIENLNQLGTLYRRKKDLEHSIRNFEQALLLCEAQKNFTTAAYIYGNLATLYCEWEQPEAAIPFSRKAIEYAHLTGNMLMVGTCYTNLGAILCNLPSRRVEGITVLKQAIPVLKSVNGRSRLCEVYNYLTNAYRAAGRRDSAMAYLDSLDVLSDALSSDVGLYRYYQAKASLLQDVGQYSAAIGYYSKLVDMMDDGYHDTRDYEHYANIANCYLKLNQPLMAFNNLQKAYALRDSSFQNTYSELLSDYSVKYETKEKELMITRLQEQQLREEQRSLWRKAISGGVVSVLIIVLLALLYARQRQKARLAVLARAAEEKERQFMALQKDTEQRLTRKYIDGLESERERMASELHDDVCNSMLALELEFRDMPSDISKELKPHLEVLSGLRERLRTLSHELMPPVFQYATIDEMLADYIFHLALPDGQQASYHSTEGVDWSLVPQNIGFEFYRIVQEAVSNAVKYSEAAHIDVSLGLHDQVLSISVADDGKGFDRGKKSKGFGLRTIWQRAGSVGAAIELGTAPGKGVRLYVSVNIGKNDGQEHEG